MTLSVDDVVQVVLTWDTPLASVAQNVWHMKMVSGAGADELDILPDIETQLQVAIADIASHINDGFAAVLLELYKYDFTNHQWDGLDSEVVSSVVGTDAGDYLPHGVAMLGRVLTERLRRQGRTFIPGPADTAVLDGILVAAVEANVALFMADWLTDIVVTGGQFTWCTFNLDVLSALYETASLTTGGVIVNSLPGYQRRRKPNVGL